MGRPHGLKFPEHLYLSPPTPPQPTLYSFASASSFLSVKSAVYYSAPAALFQEAGERTALGVSDRIPGLKIPAAFLTTLRANLVLESDSTPPSLANTPDCLRPMNMASSSGPIPPPLPSPLAQSLSSQEDRHEATVTPTASNDLHTLPPLTTAPAGTEDDKVEALHLLADSVAQQRQLASRAVLFHPSTLSLVILALGLVYQYLYHGSRSDLALVGTTTAGVLMALLITVRWMTSGYIEEAERIGTWKWLNLGRTGPSSGDIVGTEDEILLTRFGDEVIGTIFVRGVRDAPPSSPSSPSRSGSGSPRKSRARNLPTTALIRGWTVKRKYRHQGIGRALLEEAVSLAQQKGWIGPDFSTDHAHSARLLPATFSGGFVKREKLSEGMLVAVKDEQNVLRAEGKGERKRGKR